MNLIINGLLAGAVVSIMIGPIFFGLIQLAIERSIKAAIIYASGIWVSDLIYVSIVQKGLGYISSYENFKLIFGIIGTVILVSFGLGIYLSPIKKQTTNALGIKTGFGFFLKGIVINVFNPFVFVLWIGILSAISHETINNQWYYVGALLFVVAVTDIIKAYYANKIGKLLNESNLIIVKKISGALLGIFGIALLIRTLISIQ